MSNVIEDLKKKIENFQVSAKTEKIGRVLEVGDGIAKVSGLHDLQASEMLEFANGTIGVALNLEHDAIGVVLLGEYSHIKEGDPVKGTGKILSVPVGEGLIGRVVNPLGEPIDNKGPIKS